MSMFSRVQVVAGLVCCLFASVSTVQGDGTLNGQARVEKIKDRPGDYINLYEWNIYAVIDAGTGPGDFFRVGDPGTCGSGNTGCYTFTMPGGNYSLYLDQPLFWGRPTVVSNVTIPSSGSTSVNVELPIDYSCAFGGNMGEWGTDPWTSWASVWYQTFTATGTSVTGVNFKLAGHSATEMLVSIHKDNGGNITTWPQVGISRVKPNLGDLGDQWVRFRSGMIPTTPGQRYALKLTGQAGLPDDSYAIFRRIEDGQGYAGGQAYNSAGVAQNFDLYAVVFSDNDGTLVPYCSVVHDPGELAGWDDIGWAQEVKAAGGGAAGACLYYAGGEYGWDIQVDFSIYRYSGSSWVQEGPTKTGRGASQASNSGIVAVGWNPGEVNLTPGEVYRIDMRRVNGFNPYRFTRLGAGQNNYLYGNAVKGGVDGSVQSGVDLLMQVVEYAAEAETGHCGDGVDNDADGAVDCDDSDCFGDSTYCTSESNCSDGFDNDDDGLIDCADDDCTSASSCIANLLTNGGFEGYGSGSLDNWSADVGAGLSLQLNNTWDWTVSPVTMEGDHKASISSGTNGGFYGWAYQEVSLSPYSGPVNLTGWIGGGSTAVGTTIAVYLIDGPYAGTEGGNQPKTTNVIDKLEFTPHSGSLAWTGVDLGGTTGTGTVTVVWGICAAPGDGQPWGAQTVHGDGFVLTIPPEFICSDGVDNDGDGATDCADLDCDLEPVCAAIEICDNGIDDDGDGLTDCCDGACLGNPVCAEVCSGGGDEDCDGLIDCADHADCDGDASCDEGSCSDGIDNDGDGLTDCCDEWCVGDPSCAEVCSGGTDEDCDGSVDCDDVGDCLLDPACAGWNQLVNGGFEGNGSGSLANWSADVGAGLSFQLNNTWDWTVSPVTMEGAHKASISSGTNGGFYGWAYQEVSLSPYSGPVYLTGWVGGGSTAVGTTIAVYLIDGPYAGTEGGNQPKTTNVIDKLEFTPHSGSLAWTGVDLGGTTGTGTVTVVWGICAAPGDGQPWGAQTVHGDGFVLTVSLESDCSDGIDNDGDGLTDCCDATCLGDPSCVEVCNGVDDDCDGLTDEDAGCVSCAAPVLQGAVSRKTHSTAGTWDIDIGAGDIECRSVQVGTVNPNELTIVATFDIPVAIFGGASAVQTDLGTVSSVVAGATPEEVVITLTNLALFGQVNLTFDDPSNGVVDANCPTDPAYASASSLCLRIIVGDYDNLARTNFLDFAKIKNAAYLNQLVSSVDMARADFDCNSRPNFLDFAKVKNAGLLNKTAAACTAPITP